MWDSYKRNISKQEYQKEKRERDRSRIRHNSNWQFLQINVRHQITDLGLTDNSKQSKWVNVRNLGPNCIIFKLKKVKDKSNFEKPERFQKYFLYREAKIRILSGFSEFNNVCFSFCPLSVLGVISRFHWKLNLRCSADLDYYLCICLPFIWCLWLKKL